MKESKQQKQSIGENIFLYLVAIPSYLIGLSGIGVLLYQVYFWLRNGTWKTMPAVLFLVHILPTKFMQWLTDETSWLGVKKMITYVCQSSLAGFLILFAMIYFCGCILLVPDNIQQKE